VKNLHWSVKNVIQLPTRMDAAKRQIVPVKYKKRC